MPLHPFSEFMSTLKDGVSKALRFVGETKITGGYSPANTTLQNGATANGNGTNMDVNDYATVMLDAHGTFSATINFEGSIDDTNWYPLLAVKRGDGAIASTTATTGLYEINVSAVKSIRARISGYASGSVTVVGKASPLVNSEKNIMLSGSNAMLISTQAIGTLAAGAGIFLADVDVAKYSRISMLRVIGADNTDAMQVNAYWKRSTAWLETVVPSGITSNGGTTQVKSQTLTPYVKNNGVGSGDAGTLYVYGMVM